MKRDTKELVSIIASIVGWAILALIYAMMISSCNGERSRAAADARAGLQAAAAHADDKGKQILKGVDARLPAACGVPTAEWPAPTMSPQEIEADTPKYISTAPGEPSGGWAKFLAISTAVALPCLYLAKEVAKSVPGVGTLAGSLGDMAFNLIATKDHRAADQARSTVQTAAPELALLFSVLQSAHPELYNRIPPGAITAIQQLADTHGPA